MQGISIDVNEHKPIVCCPQRWWFRWFGYLGCLYILINPYLQDDIWGVLPLLAYYIARMSDVCVFDEGIEINIYGYKRLIQWNKIRAVWLTPKQIIISEGFILFPIVIFPFRKNFLDTQDILELKLGDKVRRFSFPVPL